MNLISYSKKYRIALNDDCLSSYVYGEQNHIEGFQRYQHKLEILSLLPKSEILLGKKLQYVKNLNKDNSGL